MYQNAEGGGEASDGIGSFRGGSSKFPDNRSSHGKISHLTRGAAHTYITSLRARRRIRKHGTKYTMEKIWNPMSRYTSQFCLNYLLPVILRFQFIILFRSQILRKMFDIRLRVSPYKRWIFLRVCPTSKMAFSSYRTEQDLTAGRKGRLLTYHPIT